MPSDDKRQTSDTHGKALSRRRYVQALAAAGIGGVAGCGGDGDGTATNEPTDAPTDTATDTPSDGTPEPGEPTDTPTDTPGQTTRDPANAQSDEITIPIVNVAQQMNFNIYAPSPQSTGMGRLVEMPNATAKGNNAWLLNTTYEAPDAWGGEFTVPTIQTNVDIEPPFDTFVDMHPELTYWDGTPIDAKAREMYDYITFGQDGNLFADAATFNTEIVEDFRVRISRNKGEVEGQSPDPANARTLRNNALWGEVPLHPDRVQEYYDGYQDASSSDQASTVTSNLESDNITIFEWADQGLGSGLYRIESSDDVSAVSFVANLRDDHPASAHAEVPKLRGMFATANRRTVLQNQGEIDVDEGFIKESGARWVRSSLPDYIQQISSWLETGGDQLCFNWQNQHLQNLWVRRAIIAAVDWIQVGINGWGARKSSPMTVHSGMSETQARQFFGNEFCNQLYTWPMRSNTQLASEWMTNAGYTKTGGRWVSPDGEEITLRYIYDSTIVDWVGRVQTVSQNLRDFGIGVNLQGMQPAAWHNALNWENLNYDLNAMWGPGAAGPSGYYWGRPGWWIDHLHSGGPNGEWSLPADAEVDAEGLPMHVQIPAEVGSIEAPSPAGRTPDLSNGIEIDIAQLTNSLRSPDITQEQFMENCKLLARFYNYYVPDFMFHQYATGAVGNVRDFSFLQSDHQAMRAAPTFGADEYIIEGGIPRLKYDDEYPEPQTF